MGKTYNHNGKYVKSKTFRKERKIGRGTILIPTSEIMDGIHEINKIVNNISSESEMFMATIQLQGSVSSDIIDAYLKHPEIFKNRI